jgi:hypothetical protein
MKSLVDSPASSVEHWSVVSTFQSSKISNFRDFNTTASSASLSLFSNHNLGLPSAITMASYCNPDSSDVLKLEPDPPDPLQQLFASLSDHISRQTLQIQEQLQLNDIKNTQDQESFKIEVRQELDEFRALLARQPTVSVGSTPGNPTPVQPSLPPVVTHGSGPGNTSLTLVGNAPSSTVDLQAQMMLFLSESFSKLTTFLSDQKPDSKTEWHKFSGDSKKFRA